MKKAAWCVVLTGILSPVLAASKLEPPDLDRYLRWGVVRARPSLALTHVGYDDNILVSNEGNQTGDFTATLSPKLDGLVLLGQRSFTTFIAQLAYKGYAENTDQNYLDGRFSTRLTMPFRSRRVGFYGDVGYSLTHERPVDLERARPEVRRGNLGLGFILRPGARTEIEVGRILNDVNYTDPDLGPLTGFELERRLDRTEQGTNLDIDYQMFGRTKILIRGLWQDIVFDHPFFLDDLPIQRDTREWRLMTGMEFGRGGPLTGIVLVGWDRIVPDSPLLETFSDLVGEANMFYRLNSRTRFEIRGERLPGFAVFGANSYYLLQNLNLRAVYFFTRAIGLEAGGGVGRLTFPASLNLLGRVDRLTRYELGVRLRVMENSMGRRTEYALRLTHYDRVSTVPAVDRSVNTIGFNAVVGF